MVCGWVSEGQQARLDNHYGYCTLTPDHDGPCAPEPVTIQQVGTLDEALPCGCIPYEHEHYGPCHV